MANDADSTTVVKDGPRGRVVYAIAANGDVPARDYVRNADAAIVKKFMYLFDRMCSHGEIRNEEQFNHERGRIYVFKTFKHRIYCFQHRRDWVLTHGAMKKRDKADPKELDRAERIMEEHKTRGGFQ